MGLNQVAKLQQLFLNGIKGAWLNSFWRQLGQSVTFCNTNDDVATTEILQVIGKRTDSAQNGFRVPTLFEFNALTFHYIERRFRSVIGEFDFLNRFPDTNSNQNRKRSNVVFQTFLCETLSAADIPDIPALKSRTDLKAEAQDLLAAGDPHGSDPNCIGCHYRLDPMARFFDSWRPPYPGSLLAVYDPQQKASGTLVERNADGSIRRSSGQGDTDLASLLSTSPNVHACIAKKVWEFVQGTGVRLDPVFGAELVDIYRHTDSLRSVVAAAATNSLRKFRLPAIAN